MSGPQNYRMIRVIGSGVFGYVFEVENRATKKRGALKRVEKISNQLSREYEILHMIQGCKNIVKIEEFFYSKNNQGRLIQNIVFEFVEDNLERVIERHIKDETKIPQRDIKSYAYQLLNGLRWIHNKKIAHRDLKPENVLLSKAGIIKICDFGSSKVIDEKGKNTPYIVSRYYRAPELILCITKYGVQIDIWAAGCILAELYLQTPLFKGKTEGDQLFKIFEIMGSMNAQEIKQYKALVPFDNTLIDQLSSNHKRSLSELLGGTEDKKNLMDLLCKMLTYIPSKRITAQEAMNHPYFKEFNDMKGQGKGDDYEYSGSITGQPGIP